jgi:hypothetical protein
MADLIITTQDELPGPDGDAPYVLFVNETNHGNTRFLRTNVLSARPDLKKYTSIRFRQDIKRHPDEIEPEQDLVMVFLEALDLDPPLSSLRCSTSPGGRLSGGAGGGD